MFSFNAAPKMETVLARLIHARRLCGMTQSQAAGEIGIHRPTLTLVEQGGQRLTVELLFKMCAVYCKYPSAILRPGDDPFCEVCRERKAIGEE